MIRSLVSILVSTVALSLLNAAAQQDAATHPCQQFTVRELSQHYGTERYGLDPAASINDIIFIRPLPDLASLTHAERYMIAGLTKRPRGSGNMDSWHADLFRLLHPYLLDGNPVPERLSDDVLTYVFGQVTPDNWMPGFLKSPLHGDYPRLSAREFSPGDAYVRVLTVEELAHVAPYDAVLQDALSAEGALEPLGPVVYLRIYGHSGVIENTLSYILVPRH